MRLTVLAARVAVDEKTAVLRAAKSPKEKERAEAELSLARADLALALNPSSKMSYKKKTTTVEEEEDDGDDTDDDDDDEDEDEEEDEEDEGEEEEKMPPAEDEEEETSDEEDEKAAKAAVHSARVSLAKASPKNKAVRGARLSAAKQHLKSVRAKAVKASVQAVPALRAEVRKLTKALTASAKQAAGTKKLRARLETVERFVAIGQLAQPDPATPTTPATGGEPTAEQAAIWTKMGMPAELQKTATEALVRRKEFEAKVTGKVGN